MLSAARRAEFDRRGILRLPGTMPPAEVTAMRQRLWQHLAGTHGIHPDRPGTWTVRRPAQFQKLTGTGAFDAMATSQLTTPAGPHAASAPVRSREVKVYLHTLHPWLRDLWQAHPQADRIHRYLTEGADIDGVPVRVEELTGEPGDAVIMHPRLLHVVAPNSLDTPRLMLLQFLHRQL